MACDHEDCEEYRTKLRARSPTLSSVKVWGYCSDCGLKHFINRPIDAYCVKRDGAVDEGIIRV